MGKIYRKRHQTETELLARYKKKGLLQKVHIEIFVRRKHKKGRFVVRARWVDDRGYERVAYRHGKTAELAWTNFYASFPEHAPKKVGKIKPAKKLTSMERWGIPEVGKIVEKPQEKFVPAISSAELEDIASYGDLEKSNRV